MPLSKKDISVFSARLKSAREDKGLKQEELADLIGISAPTLSRYENIRGDKEGDAKQANEAKRAKKTKDGTSSDTIRQLKVYPPLHLARDIAHTLNVSLDWLCGLTDSCIAPRTENLEMLHRIADMMKDNSGSWTLVTDVVEKCYDENNMLQLGNSYCVAIGTTDPIFYSFIFDYQKALRAGVVAIENGVPAYIADSIKDKVFEKYVDDIK